jgi:hypothetical protein
MIYINVPAFARKHSGKTMKNKSVSRPNFEPGNSRVQFANLCLRGSAPNGVGRQRCVTYWCGIEMAMFRNNLSICLGDYNKPTSSCRHS